MEIGEVDVERREADGVDQQDVQPAIVPAGDALPVILPVLALPLRHRRRCELHDVLPGRFLKTET